MEKRNLSGFTLFVKCKCAWESSLHCKNKATAETEEKKIKRCPCCASDDLLIILKRGLYRKDELTGEIKNEFLKKELSQA